MNALGMYWDGVYRAFRREDSPFASNFETKLMVIDEDDSSEAQRGS